MFDDDDHVSQPSHHWGLLFVVSIVVVSVFVLRHLELETKSRSVDARTRQQFEDALNRIEQRRGVQFASGERAQVLEIAGTELGAKVLQKLPELPAAEQAELIEGLIRLSLMRRGRSLPTPKVISREVLQQTSDDALPGLLYDAACQRLGECAKYQQGDLPGALDELPRGLRLAYTLTALESEVFNGGFLQFFSNSTGEIAAETLEDCRTVGAVEHARLLTEAIELHERAETIAPDAGRRTRNQAIWNSPLGRDFERLDSAYTRIVAEEEPIYGLLLDYARRFPEKFVAVSRQGTTSDH